MNILLTTNKFQQFAGAEIVTLEIAEHLRAAGHDCTIACWYLGPPMKAIAARLGIAVTDRPETLNAFAYDLVWAHHHIAPVLRYEVGADARPRTCFAWRHLSAVGHFELPGLVLQDLVCDRAYAVSDETRQRLIQVGMDPALIRLFPNPAPDAFHRPGPRPRRDTLASLLVVSNHAPSELLAALPILASHGVRVRHIGSNGEGQRRVTPDLLEDADAVVTIGKTVQYALCRRIPVYVYDQFGGPGYLAGANFETASSHNFSGRCGGRKLAAPMLAQELREGFPAAAQFIATMDPARLDAYRLAPYLDDLLHAAAHAMPNTDRLSILQAHRAMLARERAFCAGAGVTYRGHHAFKRKFEGK